MEQTTSACRFNRSVAPGYYRMGITCPESYAKAVPGQFVMVGFPGISVPLLRRPFSIHGLHDTDGRVDCVEILYKVVGPATRRMAACGPGEPMSLLGPLGNGFTLSRRYQNVWIVAGGIGVAPLVFLADRSKSLGMDLSLWQVFLGGRSASDILCGDFFSNLGCRLRITTDDGSLGDRGLVTQPVEATLAESVPDMIYACGPHAMLGGVADCAAKYHATCQVSVETLMACGIGACLGCAVSDPEDSSRYRHVCKDGPVFDSRSLWR